MQYLKLKDKKFRHVFQKLELKLKLKKFIFINLLANINRNKLPLSLKKTISYQIQKKKRFATLSKIIRRCILTNRSKSIRFLKISRIQSKELISFGIIPGYKKAVW